MSDQKDSVARGGGSVVAARLLGMLFSFLLFVVLARESASEAGIFRTVMTYIGISEFLGMLGLHRWLATEIAAESGPRWPLYQATQCFTIGVCLLISVIYLAIAASGTYSAGLSRVLVLGTLSVVPSGVFACVQSALVGVGRSRVMGRLNLIENLARCIPSIALIALHRPVIEVIGIFVLVRWLIALAGLYEVRQRLAGDHWLPSGALLRQVARQAPRFATIIAAFLVVRNAGLVILPAMDGETQAAVFAVAYQLFDLLLLVPSVLALTSNNLFATRAVNSKAALKKAATQLLALTAVAMFPCAVLAAAFAGNVLHLLYGDRYGGAVPALILLMLTAMTIMVDQVLSQVMVARRDYQSDMHSIVTGAVTALILTPIGVQVAGPAGAAWALLLSSMATVGVRLRLLRALLSLRLLLLTVWRPVVAAALVYLVITAGFAMTPSMSSRFLWLLGVPPALALYAGLTYALGGASLSRRRRLKQFLFHSH